MRGALTTIVLAATAILSSTTEAQNLTFPDSGSWSLVRVYEGTTLAAEPLRTEIPYTFKTRPENQTPETLTEILTGQITGPQNFYWNHGEITLNPEGESIRQHTETFTTPGEYTARFDLENAYVETNFTIIPEPTLSLILGAGALALHRKRKQ